jgi:predicted transcriptional regulator
MIYQEVTMTTTTIRVSAKTHNTLRDLARTIGAPMQEIVEQAVEQYRRQRLLAATNAAYAALQADPDAWQEVREERAMWDVTLADGLEEV